MRLLKWFFEPGCAHRFTWPRMERNGRHYQICLDCATAYAYDWEKMQRTKRPLTAQSSTSFPEPMPAARVWQRTPQGGKLNPQVS